MYRFTNSDLSASHGEQMTAFTEDYYHHVHPASETSEIGRILHHSCLERYAMGPERIVVIEKCA